MRPRKTPLIFAIKALISILTWNASSLAFFDYTENIEFIEQLVGFNVELHCGLKGLIEETRDPNPKIHWFFKPCIECSHIASVEDWKRLPCEGVFCRTDLLLRNVTNSYSGFYKCTAYPQHQNTEQALDIQLVRLFQLNVKNESNSAPDFLDFLPLNKSVIEGASAVLQCKVHSTVHPTIKWFRRLQISSGSNGAEVSQGNENFSSRIVKYNGHLYELLTSTREKSVNVDTYLSKLFIKKALLRDEGFYACVAISYLGHRIREAFLEVQPTEVEYWADYDNSDEEYTDPKQFWLLFFIPLSLALLPLTLWLCYSSFKKFGTRKLQENYSIEEESAASYMLKK